MFAPSIGVTVWLNLLRHARVALARLLVIPQPTLPPLPPTPQQQSPHTYHADDDTALNWRVPTYDHFDIFSIGFRIETFTVALPFYSMFFPYFLFDLNVNLFF